MNVSDKVRSSIREGVVERIRLAWRDAFLDSSDEEAKKDFYQTRTALGGFIGEGASCERRNSFFAVLANTNNPMKAKFYALLAKAMQLEGYSPVIINSDHSVDAQRYFRLFGFERYIRLGEYSRSVIHPAEAEAIALTILPRLLSMDSITKCTYMGIPVGTYALSSACRTLKCFPPDLNESPFRESFIKFLIAGVVAARTAVCFFNDYSVSKLLLRDVGYVPNGPFLNVALGRGIDCLAVANGQRRGTWIFKRYNQDNRSEHEFSISPINWPIVTSFPWSSSMNLAVDDELRLRYGESSDVDTRRLQSNKTLMSPEEVRTHLRLDASKKTAVIFSHVSWDGAFFFGEDLYDNFDDWLVSATRCAIDNPNLNWIIKLHPLNVLLHAFDGVGKFQESEMDHLRQLGPLPDHVKIMHSDTPVNTASLFPVIDYGLTVRGTIGLELPCLGIPVLTAGTGRYEGRGFTIDSTDKAVYRSRLADLHNVPRLPPSTVRLARVHYYHLMIRRQVSFEDIAPMTFRQLNEADSSVFNNIDINARSLQDIRSARSIAAFVSWAHRLEDPDFFTDMPSGDPVS